MTKNFQKAMSENGVDTIYFNENFWHYVPNWEHFLAKSTACSAKYPFADPSDNGKARVRPGDVPAGGGYPRRTLFMGIPVKMAAGRIEAIAAAAQKAAKAI